jgi:hypothetical protein
VTNQARRVAESHGFQNFILALERHLRTGPMAER